MNKKKKLSEKEKVKSCEDSKEKVVDESFNLKKCIFYFETNQKRNCIFFYVSEGIYIYNLQYS
ncbi:hypothetical protein, partial [Klebsiella pneumoniae]|uniref:hypothetical protein n=1 Tax=Klebsiella pneumoniae TaxID=573 RepID=UPI003F5231BC